ncbi:C39 family peptidase [Secundilactobacillus paracollinoides]|uniref:C39 family peptidase n=1 Tax=Secundilactobacillus paracollinoides TaxID=240427 RepID=UPI001CDAC8F9|nr:C39 family peptidase [Secundilactobacillus paracollinoides]
MKITQAIDHQRAIVGNQNGTRLVDNTGALIDMLSFQDLVTITQIMTDNHQEWAQTRLGLVPLEDLVFVPNITVSRPLTAQTIIVSQLGGVRGVSTAGDFGNQYAFKQTVAIQADVTATDARYFETTNGDLILQDACHIVGQPMVVTFRPTTASYLQVVTPTGAQVFNDAEQVVDRLAAGSLRTIIGEVVDELGQYFIQIENKQYVAKTNVVLLSDNSPVAINDYMMLGAENINQLFCGMPNGCEPAALLMGLHWKAEAATLDYGAFLAEMPIAADYNPYHGFGGDPADDVAGRFEAIFPEPLTKWANRYGRARNVSGADTAQLKDMLTEKNPIVTYVTVGFETPVSDDYAFGRALSNNHAVLLDGRCGELLHVSDPIDGAYWLPVARFEKAYNARHWAVELL